MAYLNRADALAYAARHYQAHKADYVARSRARNRRVAHANRQRLARWLRSHPCADCQDPTATAIHRLDPGLGVRSMVNGGYRWETIAAILARSLVLCQGCLGRRRRAAMAVGI